MARDSQGITQYYLPPHTSHTCLYAQAAEHHRPLVGTQLRLPMEGWPG